MTQSIQMNNLLSALPRNNRRQLIACCESIELINDDVLYLPGKPIPYIYFPTSGCISLVRKINNISSIEIALIGNEGMLGIGAYLGITDSLLHVSVKSEGSAFRLRTALFLQELRQNPALQKLIDLYIYVRLNQVTQLATCTRFHVIESRLARWLLLRYDRAPTEQIHITQQSLATILGVRRVGITNAALSLQNRHLIVYNRGILTIINRKGLEAASCDCYQVDKTVYEQTMAY